MGNLGEINREDLPENESSFDPIPAGTYPAEIQKAELKDTKSGTGKYIHIQWGITGEQYTGRVVFEMVNFQNANKEAEAIGQATLRGIMEATGLAKLTDTDQLIGRRCQIRVKVRPASGDYDAQNEVKGHKTNGSEQPSTPVSGGSSSGAPPWAKK